MRLQLQAACQVGILLRQHRPDTTPAQLPTWTNSMVGYTLAKIARVPLRIVFHVSPSHSFEEKCRCAS